MLPKVERFAAIDDNGVCVVIIKTTPYTAVTTAEGTTYVEETAELRLEYGDWVNQISETEYETVHVKRRLRKV